jgi:hypothetical protein
MALLQDLHDLRPAPDTRDSGPVPAARLVQSGKIWSDYAMSTRIAFYFYFFFPGLLAAERGLCA